MRSENVCPSRALMLVLVACCLLSFGCASTTTYVRPDTVTKTMDFSDTDLRMNAEAMVNSLTEADFLYGLDEKPVLALGGIQNRTNDHIDTRSLENTIQTVLFKSGLFRFVDRDMIEKAAQEKAMVDMRRIDVADAVKLGNITGADFFLLGDLSAIDTTHGRRDVAYKKLTMKLVNVETSEVVWLDEKEIKKATR